MERFTVTSNDLILITGATGFLGHHIKPIIQNTYSNKIVSVGSKDYDLTKEDNVKMMYEDINPTIVFHLAAYVGGIGANRAYPADFFWPHCQYVGCDRTRR